MPVEDNEFYHYSLNGKEKNTLPSGIWDLQFEDVESHNKFILRYVLDKKTDMTNHIKVGKLIKFTQIQ